MRIIAGVAKGHNLTSIADSTRPTSDRAREALFSSLHSEFGDFANLNFLDLYAGSGAVGLEALSRGFKYVVSVEKDESAIKAIKSNYESVQRAKPNGIFSVQANSVTKFLSHEPNEKFDVVFFDPPYEVANSEIVDLLKLLINSNFLNQGATVVVERANKGGGFNWPLGLTSTRERDYGSAIFYFATFEL